MVTRNRGFTLIELLVVIAVIGVLIQLIIPNVSSVRQAAAQAQVDKSTIIQRLCDPPFCDVLRPGVFLAFPAISQSLTASDILDGGLGISYNPALLANGEPFSVETPGTPDTTFVDIDLPPLFDTEDFRILDANYQNNRLLLQIGQDSTADSFTLSAIRSADGLSFKDASVPEPGSAMPVLAVLGAALAARWRRHRKLRARHDIP